MVPFLRLFLSGGGRVGRVESMIIPLIRQLIFNEQTAHYRCGLRSGPAMLEKREMGRRVLIEERDWVVV